MNGRVEVKCDHCLYCSGGKCTSSDPLSYHQKGMAVGHGWHVCVGYHQFSRTPAKIQCFDCVHLVKNGHNGDGHCTEPASKETRVDTYIMRECIHHKVSTMTDKPVRTVLCNRCVFEGKVSCLLLGCETPRYGHGCLKFYDRWGSTVNTFSGIATNCDHCANFTRENNAGGSCKIFNMWKRSDQMRECDAFKEKSDPMKEVLRLKVWIAEMLIGFRSDIDHITDPDIDLPEMRQELEEAIEDLRTNKWVKQMDTQEKYAEQLTIKNAVKIISEEDKDIPS